jgi:hypothetical protein
VTERKPAHKEFKVTIDVKLPQDVLDRIDRAIQKTALNELADADVADGYSSQPCTRRPGDQHSAAPHSRARPSSQRSAVQRVLGVCRRDVAETHLHVAVRLDTRTCVTCPLEKTLVVVAIDMSATLPMTSATSYASSVSSACRLAEIAGRRSRRSSGIARGWRTGAGGVGIPVDVVSAGHDARGRARRTGRPSLKCRHRVRTTATPLRGSSSCGTKHDESPGPVAILSQT